MEEYKFSCGCSFPILQKREGQLPLLEIDPDNFPDCKAVWDLLGTGKTKGIFQLESQLGKTWCGRLKPENIEHLGALGAILRPSCLQSKCELGQSMTEKYCLRKNNQQESKCKYPILKSVLDNTYSILIYQEQITKIAEVICGFDLMEQEALRKSVSKKDQASLAKSGRLFVEKAVLKGLVTKEQAEDIFSDIQKSGRYCFCKAHAISYGLKGYKTAYIKQHFPEAFYTSWLSHASEKSDPRQEVLELVEDAKNFDIKIETPNILDLEKTFYPSGGMVKFGLSNVKSVGPKQVDKLIEGIKGFKPIKECCWTEFLYNLSEIPNSTAIKGWISTGAFKWTKLSRIRMIKEYEAWIELTVKEKEWIREHANDKNLTDALKLVGRSKKDGGGCHTQRRADVVSSISLLLENQASTDDDHPNQIVDMEETYLGVAISCNRIDACDISMVNCTCSEFLAGRSGKIYLGVEVKDVRVIKTKKGDEMAFAAVSDSSCLLSDVCIFSEQWSRYKDLFRAKNTLVLQGKRDNKRGSFMLEKAFQI